MRASRRLRAALDKSQRNLDFCVIRSPVKGLIIDPARVNIGRGRPSSQASMLREQHFFSSGWARICRSYAGLGRGELKANIDHVHPGAESGHSPAMRLDGDSFTGVVNKVRPQRRRHAECLSPTLRRRWTPTIPADGFDALPDGQRAIRGASREQRASGSQFRAAMVSQPAAAEEVVPDARSQWKPVEEEDASDFRRGSTQTRETSPPAA